MSEVALADPTTETKAANTEDTEGIEESTATDPVASAQTEEKPAKPATSSLLDAIKEGDEADLEARIQAEARKLLRTDKAEKRSATLKTNLADKFNKTIADLVGSLGEDATDPIWKAMNALHLSVGEAAIAAVREEYEEWLEDFIPEADREAYHKEMAGQSTEAKFKAAAEYLVSSTKAIKSMTLEDFTKHSTKGRSDLKAALKEAEEAGYKRGLDAPAGDATAEGDKRSPQPPTELTLESALTLPLAELKALRARQRAG